MATRSRKKTFLPPAPHIVSKKEKETLCVVLYTLSISDGNNSNHINHIYMEELKLHSMKAHDFHVLMPDSF